MADGHWWRRLPPRAVALAALGAGLALAAAGTGTGGFLVADQERPSLRSLLQDETVRTEPADPPAPIPESIRWIARWAEVVLQVAVAVLILAALLYGVREFLRGLARLRRLREERSRGRVRPLRYDEGEWSDEEGVEELRRRVSHELDLLASDLDAAPDPREAVIACYARMETLAAAAGTSRQRHETPTELLGRLLDEQQAPETAVRRLTALFEEARFSKHRVDDVMRAEARASLDAVRNAISVRA